MSEPDAVPLPREGEVFFDVRGDARTMRLSWYADSQVAVFSIWQGNRCTGTFRLPFADLSRMVRTLQSGPAPRGTDRGPSRPPGPAGIGYPDSGYGYPDRDVPAYGGAPNHGVIPDYGHARVPADMEPQYSGYGADPGYGLSDYDPPNYSDAPRHEPERRPARGYSDPGYPSPGYAGSGYADPGYPPRGYPGPGSSGPRHAQPGYTGSRQVQHGYPDPARPYGAGTGTPYADAPYTGAFSPPASDYPNGTGYAAHSGPLGGSYDEIEPFAGRPSQSAYARGHSGERTRTRATGPGTRKPGADETSADPGMASLPSVPDRNEQVSTDWGAATASYPAP
jgi:hypothetical protein